MNNPLVPPRDPDEPDIADAASLFGESRESSPKSQAPPSSSAAASDDYAIADRAEAPRRVVPTFEDDDSPPETRKPPRGEGPVGAKRPKREASEAVEQVWTRGAEWGTTIGVLALAIVGLLILMFILFSVEQYGLAFFAMLASVPVLGVIAYPILITLERPVRVTPEQAIRDYYGALSHHLPHYRRMWLLLSSAGRVSGSFASFEGFSSYWKTRMIELRAGKAGGFTPLKFKVDNFRAEKSAGLSEIDVTYNVNVFIRGRQDEGPIESASVNMSLVKGPDRMWYLDRGTFP